MNDEDRKALFDSLVDASVRIRDAEGLCESVADEVSYAIENALYYLDAAETALLDWDD